jgi:hypothetical protein
LKIENPITELQKKNKKFIWIEKCTEAVQKLKDLLMTLSILKVPDMKNELLVFTDVSKEVIGRVLIQDD